MRVSRIFQQRYGVVQRTHCLPLFRFPHRKTVICTNHLQCFRPSILFQQQQQQRWTSSSTKEKKQFGIPIISKSELRSLIAQKGDYVLIDVREPSEYAAGHIETAYNVPIKKCLAFLSRPANEWEKQFNFPKPPPDKCLIFYCHRGLRSAVAAGYAQHLGYKNVKSYRGSWAEWSQTD